MRDVAMSAAMRYDAFASPRRAAFFVISDFADYARATAHYLRCRRQDHSPHYDYIIIMPSHYL